MLTAKNKDREGAGALGTACLISRQVDSTPTLKEFSTVQARYALAGHVLNQASEGDYITMRHKVTRYLKCWPEVLAYMRLIEG